MTNHHLERNRLVEELRCDGHIFDERVLSAMNIVPRHLFVPPNMVARAYENCALPIAQGQTISQPFIVAFMAQSLRLKPSDRLLEIGTGSGYNAAVMSLIAREVFTVEIVPELGNASTNLFQTLDYRNIHTRIGDGYEGWPTESPFDAIILTAAPEKIPKVLIDQLAEGGRLIAPVGKNVQKLILLEKDEKGKVSRQHLLDVVFVPMTGMGEK
jgi:protein-L-isoaspartate(D-aspartate) O-methyltransferase